MVHGQKADNRLAVVEMATGSGNGERIADEARRRWPGNPIRYALFSHHHPHYVGGVRALIAEGATVITTPGNGGSSATSLRALSTPALTGSRFTPSRCAW